ncbi:MobC family plasmid mobilization relaxosome protein [Neisseria gonorrhoeae]|uniref:MobC family plasmid mobilization relaxosome protein n=3 Tax=Neisseria gonorrhoeae TaxID=485 RepID=UPI00311F6195
MTRQKTHPNLARYIRERVLEDGKASDKKTVKFQFPPEVVRVLAGMGNNLNQIAKALNTAAKVGTLGNVEALKATTELAALERFLNSLRDFLAKEKNGWQSQ